MEKDKCRSEEKYTTEQLRDFWAELVKLMQRPAILDPRWKAAVLWMDQMYLYLSERTGYLQARELEKKIEQIDGEREALFQQQDEAMKEKGYAPESPLKGTRFFPIRAIEIEQPSRVIKAGEVLKLEITFSAGVGPLPSKKPTICINCQDPIAVRTVGKPPTSVPCSYYVKLPGGGSDPFGIGPLCLSCYRRATKAGTTKEEPETTGEISDPSAKKEELREQYKSSVGGYPKNP